MVSGNKIREKFSLKNIPEEEKDRRRRMTTNTLLMLLGAAIATLLVYITYFYFVISAVERESDISMPLLINTSIAAMGLFVIMLGINQIKAIPYWVSSTIFIFMLIILGIQLFSTGLILEYLVRIHYESSDKRIYTVRNIHTNHITIKSGDS